MEQVILGLGSNVGDRAALLAAAAGKLRAQVKEMRLSSLHETPALLPQAAPEAWNVPYLNQALAGRTALSPRALLQFVKAVEAMLGRQERGRWGPREIDIDILAYGGEVIAEPDLRIPHADLLTRAFALKPLAEVAPHWIYPEGVYAGKTAAQLVTELKL